jgi:antitoxin VapB
MALNIKDEETARLAREVAQRAGESITEAICTALRERLQRLSGPQRAATQREKLYEILQRVDALPRKTDLTEDEILGYSEHGIPR